MLKIINGVESVDKLFANGNFKLERWDTYIEGILPKCKNLLLKDMKDKIEAGKFDFDKDFLPIIKGVVSKKDKRIEAVQSFAMVTENLEEKIIKNFGKTIDVTLVLHLGLCNGAGRVINLESKQYILLGIEKIIELDWCDINSMYGLIYHELGHVYQMEHGVLTRAYKGRDEFLWQLFIEGIAMNFEQRLMGDENYFHQDVNGWLSWCDTNINKIKRDFDKDLSSMTRSNQRYFGDWINYRGQPDVGYYLGARFLQWLSKRYAFDEMIVFDKSLINVEWNSYLKRSN